MTAEGSAHGGAVTSGAYFAELRQKLSCRVEPVCRSALSEARSKLSFGALKYLLHENDLQRLNRRSDKWKGHFVEAVDGVALGLPATEAVLEEFPRRALCNAGHYPKAKMVTAMNVFTGQVFRASIGNVHGGERELFEVMLEDLPVQCVCLLDRGFTGKLLENAIHRSGRHFVTRQVTRGKGVTALMQRLLCSGKPELIGKNTEGSEGIVVRAIRLRELDHEGEPIVVLTDLLDRRRYPRKEIERLYLRRWETETLYGRMKELLAVENFHARTPNGIKQEIYANLLLLSFIAALVRESIAQGLGSTSDMLRMPSFKNALQVVKRHIAELTGTTMTARRRRSLLAELLKAIMRVIHRRAPGRKLPRISHQPTPKWSSHRGKSGHNRPRNKWAKQRLQAKQQAATS